VLERLLHTTSQAAASVRNDEHFKRLLLAYKVSLGYGSEQLRSLIVIARRNDEAIYLAVAQLFSIGKIASYHLASLFFSSQ